MKRANNLFDRIAARDNLELAFYRAKRGKEWKQEVSAFRAELDQELEMLGRCIQDNTVEVGHYHYFRIRDPKERVICAASFRERVLHHAIMAVCDDAFEKYQIHDSYASRKGKGVDACLGRTMEFCRIYRWYLKLDIHKFFDSIDHAILLNLLNRRFKDQRLLYLFSRIIESYETDKGKGVPIGNLTSQYFANLYLGLMDHRIKDQWRVPGYLRYMDDFLLFSDDRGALLQWLDTIGVLLRDELKLELNEPIINRTLAGIPFLSYIVHGDHMRLSLKARRRFRRKIARADELENPNMALPLLAFINRADSYAFRKKLLGESSI